MPTTKGRRAAGFGYGERFVDTPLRLQTPSPDRYIIPDLYHQKGHLNQSKENHIKNKTFAFGAGRDNYQKVVVSEAKYPDPAIPGPGTYNPMKRLGEEGFKFKIKNRLDIEDVQVIARKRNVPAVGSYENPLQINRKGVYDVRSEWQNSRAAYWGPKTDRFRKNSKSKSPGPGAHN